MQDVTGAFGLAMDLISSADRDLLEVVLLSLKVSLLAVGLSGLVGFPLGAMLATTRFSGRTIILVMTNALMGLPPVVVGLCIYLLLSRSGPMGWLGLLYTPTAMIMAQFVLVTPIVIALSRQILEDLHEEYEDQFRSLCLSRRTVIGALLWDGRYALMTVVLAGFGRAIAEVGAVMIVGGNIDHLTRVMTTTIALETSKGDLALALALGIILLSLAMLVNALVLGVKLAATRYAYA
ncbi:MAG: ABC transporter permease [Hyphomicrobiaceae bacterium]